MMWLNPLPFPTNKGLSHTALLLHTFPLETQKAVCLIFNVGLVKACFNVPLRTDLEKKIEKNFTKLLQQLRQNYAQGCIQNHSSAYETPLPFTTSFYGCSESEVAIYVRYLSDPDAPHPGSFFIEAHTLESKKLQALGQLALGITHDFNNLLTAVLGFCDLLLQRHSPQDQSFADIMEIKQNATRATNIARQLLLFARLRMLLMFKNVCVKFLFCYVVSLDLK